MNQLITQWSPVALHHLYCFLKTPLGLNFTLCCKWTWLLWEEIKSPFSLVYFSPPDKTSDPESMILGVDSGTLLSEWHPCFRRGVLWRSQVSLACLSHCGTPSPHTWPVLRTPVFSAVLCSMWSLCPTSRAGQKRESPTSQLHFTRT